MIDTAIRVAVLLAAAWLIAAAMRRASAATRHALWVAAVAGALAMPVVATVSPQWTALPADNVQTPTPSFHSRTLPPDHAPWELEVGSWKVSRQPVVEGADGAAVLAGLWLTIAGVLLTRIALGIVAVRRLVRHATPIDGRWRSMLTAARRDLHVARRVEIAISSDVSMPMTFGGGTPMLLLPEAARAWSDDRARVVLLHELAHIARRDWTTHLFARVMAALHWYNPLAWIAVRRMSAERERACDDCVLALGASPADYASHLLEIARTQAAPVLPAAALAMARPSELEGRLLAILGTRARVSTRHALRLATAVMIALTCGIASATSAQARPPRPAPTPRYAPVMEEIAPRESPKQEIDPLVTALSDRDEDVREEAAMGLAVRSEPNVIDPLLAALHDESSQVREKAALGLAMRREPRVVDALIEAANDPDSQVREKVILALAFSRDDRAAATIARATKDPDAQVREKAVLGLSLLGRNN
jgi:bla regulator protein BlaR1